MRLVSGLVQVVFFLVLIGASLLAAGLIANRVPLTDPPGMVARLVRYLTTNVAETTADSPFPELRTRRYDAPPGLLFDVARRAAQRLGWDITSLDAEKKEIRAVVKTKVWKFEDDVTVHTPPAQPSGSWLVVRSASRIGKGDLGANTRHILDLVEAVEAMMPAPALHLQQGREAQGEAQPSGEEGGGTESKTDGEQH